MKYIFHEKNKLLIEKINNKLELKSNVIVTHGQIDSILKYVSVKTVFLIFGTATCDEIDPIFLNKFPNLHERILDEFETYGKTSKSGKIYFDIGSSVLIDYENEAIIYAPIWYTKQDITKTLNLYWALSSAITILDKYTDYETMIVSGLSELTLTDTEIANQICDALFINTIEDLTPEIGHICYSNQCRNEQPKIEENNDFISIRKRRRVTSHECKYKKNRIY